MGVTFQQEQASACFNEAKPLLEAHWNEVEPHRAFGFDPDFESYAVAEDRGVVRCYTMRHDGDLVGYALFFVHRSLHCKQFTRATQDLLYVMPAHRPRGGLFVRWCDAQLKASGVQVVYHHVTEAVNFGPLLKALGYQRAGAIWTKRLEDA